MFQKYQLESARGREEPLFPRLAPTNSIPRCLKRVEEYIDANIEMPLPLTALATCAGLSEGYFSRLFKASYQITPHQFILRLRIEKAKALLARSHHSMIEVGVMCGFPNPQHFSNRFSRAVGVSPSQYRRDGP